MPTNGDYWGPRSDIIDRYLGNTTGKPKRNRSKNKASKKSRRKNRR